MGIMTTPQKETIGVALDAGRLEKVAGLPEHVSTNHVHDLLSGEETDPILTMKMTLVNDVSVILQNPHRYFSTLRLKVAF